MNKDIETNDLLQYTKNSPQEFSTLLHKIIANMYKNSDVLSFRMPEGKDINLPDADGKLTVKIDTIFGKANEKIIFEFGVEEGWKSKFKTDIEKRMNNKDLYYGRNFIFLTSQRTKEKTKNKLIEEYKKKNFFNDIKIFDGVDIIGWINKDPAVRLWLKEKCGLSVDGIETLDFYYEKWLKSTKIPLDENLILAREFDKKELNEKINGQSPLNIQSNSVEESLVFLIAYFKNNNYFEKESRYIIVSCDSALSKIARSFNVYENTIIIPTVPLNENNIKNILFLIDKNIKIILPIERVDLIKDNRFEKIILDDIKQESYFNFFIKYKYKFNIYDMFDATGYNLINIYKYLLKIEPNEIINKFEPYEEFLISILPIYKWKINSLDENIVESFSKKDKNEVEKMLNKMLKNGMIIQRNEYIHILFMNNFIKQYNFTQYDIDNIIDKSRKIIYDNRTDNNIFSTENKSKYVINSVFDTLRIIYNENKSENIFLYNSRYKIKDFIREIINDIFSQKIDFSEYLESIASIDLELFLESIEYKLNNKVGEKEIYNFFAFKQQDYTVDKRLYFSFLKIFEELGKYKNYFSRIVKILFKIYNITQDLDYKNTNKPFNSIISIFAYNINYGNNCIDTIKELFKIDSNNSYKIVFRLIQDRLCWNEQDGYNNTVFKSIRVSRDSEVFKYCFNKCFSSSNMSNIEYGKMLLDFFKFFDKSLYDIFIEIVEKLNFIGWTLKDKKDFKKTIKTYLDAYDKKWESWFGKDYLEWDFKKLQKFYDDFILGGIDDYIFYFENINRSNISVDDKGIIVDNGWINKINEFIDIYGINKIIDLLSKNNSQDDKIDYFYTNTIIKALAKSKADFKSVIIILFNNNYYEELRQCLENDNNMENNENNIFEKSYLILNNNNSFYKKIFTKFRCFLSKYKLINKSDLFVEKILVHFPYIDKVKNFLEKYNLKDIYWKNTKLVGVHSKYLSIYIDNYKKYNNPFLFELCINESDNINDLDLILDTLINVPKYINQKYSNEKKYNNTAVDNAFSIDEYHINRMFRKIYNNNQFYMDNFDKILDIELALYDFISNAYNNYQTPRTLELKITKDPNYLLQLMSLYYLPEGLTDKEIEAIKNKNKDKTAMYNKLFIIFNYLRFIPNMEWCENILNLYEINKYKFNKFCIYRIIGQLLSNSPIDENDSIYPNKESRDIIEKYYLDAQDNKNNYNSLLTGFSNAKYNSRGVVICTNGQGEKELSDKYKQYREQLKQLYQDKYIYTQEILKNLEDIYNRESEREKDLDYFNM